MELKLTKNLLNSLLDFKNNKTELSLDLISELIDIQSELDLNYLDRLLYLDKENSPSKEERVKEIKKILEENYVWCFYKNYKTFIKEVSFSKKKEVDFTGIWILKKKENFDESEIHKFLKKKQRIKSQKVKIKLRNKKEESNEINEEEVLEIINEIKELELKKEIKKTENFETKVKKIKEVKKEENSPGPLFQFMKKVEKTEKLHTFSPYRVLDHIRRRDDLVSPKRITYINFTDSLKPPVYKIIPDKLYNVVDSTKRLPHITDYSDDSDDEWEDCEDAETLSSEESTISQEEELNDWLESDSEVVDNSSKIMTRTEPKLFFITITQPNYSLNLRRKDFLSEIEKSYIKNEIFNKKDLKKLIKEYADDNWIHIEVINNFIKEIKNEEVNEEV